MTISRHPIRVAALAALPVLLMAGAALAQDRSGGFLDNLFNPGQPPAQQQQAQQQPPSGARAPGDNGSGVEARIDRIENALRQLTGTVEQLQHQNQMLQMQLKRMQDDTEYRFQQLGARGAAPASPAMAPVPGNATPPVETARRGDAFNPALHPNAPGAPRSLAGEAPGGGVPAGAPVTNQPPVGAPVGRAAGAPLDLNSLAGTAPPASVAGPPMAPNGQLPPPPPRNTSATGVQLATLPPSGRPQDEYDLAYGYVLHKDYGLAAQAFRNFMRKYPNEKLLPEAQYWLGESLYQQRHYRAAAESFLAVSTKYEHSAKAPEALLRLGQSLSALHKKEAACATLAEVGRKYPRASARVKRSVAQEQKRAHC